MPGEVSQASSKTAIICPGCQSGFKVMRRNPLAWGRSIPWQGRKICWMGRDLFLYKDLPSTNDEARRKAQGKAPHGTIILSDYQSAGKGRIDHRWYCPPGRGLLMSIILRPTLQMADISRLTLLAGVVVADCLRKSTGCRAGIKWPNDILINGKKAAGILAEASVSWGSVEHVIIGIGINVNQSHVELPAECRDSSTSIYLERGCKTSRLKILKEFIRNWDEHYWNYLKMGNIYLQHRWLEYNVTLGREVKINRQGMVFSGTALDINEEGALLVRLNDGRVREFLAGEVSLSRS